MSSCRAGKAGKQPATSMQQRRAPPHRKRQITRCHSARLNRGPGFPAERLMPPKGTSAALLASWQVAVLGPIWIESRLSRPGKQHLPVSRAHFTSHESLGGGEALSHLFPASRQAFVSSSPSAREGGCVLGLIFHCPRGPAQKKLSPLVSSASNNKRCSFLEGQ